MTDEGTTSWLPVGEAAQHLRISVDALRKRIKREQIRSRTGNDGRVLVLCPVDGRTGPDGRGPDIGVPGPDSRGLQADGSGHADTASAELERWRQLAEDRLAQVAQLWAERDAIRTAAADELAEVRQELAAARGDVDRLRGELAQVKAVAAVNVEAANRVAEAQVASRDELVAELRALLEHTRRPWWRRLLR